jgi:hypothetical protein
MLDDLRSMIFACSDTTCHTSKVIDTLVTVDAKRMRSSTPSYTKEIQTQRHRNAVLDRDEIIVQS